MSLVEDIGGEGRVRDLVERFYDLIETLPEGENLRRLHARGHGIAHARVEQMNFLVGFMGGRHYYAEKHGHMNVKLMHEHVPVRTLDAENWLFCMDRALEMEGHAGPHIDRFRVVLRRVALMLVNEVPDWEDGQALPS